MLVTCLLSLPLAGQAAIRYAQNFAIEDCGTHRVLTVRNTTRHSDRVYRYALVPQEAELPQLPRTMPVIRTPVKRVVAMETVYIGYLEALGQLDSIIAAATVDYISNPDVRTAITSGRIQRLQSGQAIDIEKLLVLQPDLLLTSVSGEASFDIPAKLGRTNLPVVLTAGYMEAHPLARAEWIKFIAEFFDAAPRADQVFDHIEQRYHQLTRLSENIETRPTVLCGAPYSGVWHVPGGASFAAQAIRDAGGDYLWSADKTRGGIPLDTERVFLHAAHADFWIHPGFYRSMPALLAADPRFAKFAPAQTGRIFNHTRQQGPTGGNAIWESGIVHPEKVLADLVHVFHPERLPQHEFVYYQRLE